MSAYPLDVLLSPETIDAGRRAWRQFQESLPRRGIVSRKIESYPFGCNQAEWELLIFMRGWNAAVKQYHKENNDQENT